MSTQPENLDALAKLRIKRSDDAPPRRGPARAIISVGAVILVAILGGLALWSRANWSDWLSVPDAIRSRTDVRVSRVVVRKGRSADATVVASGYLESRHQAKIGARAPGRIEVINVEEGTRVKANDVLAILEHADMDAALAAARAVVAQSRAQAAEQEVEIARSKRALERATSLRGKSGISEADFDQAKFQYDATLARRDSLRAAVTLAEARVAEAEQLRENMFIRASFDGTVISKDAEVGESILPGGMGEASGRGSVVTVADLDHLEVECDVKEDYIARVTSGAAAEVAVDAVSDRRYRGRVRKIIPMGDRARATIQVKVEIVDADGRLFPEMSATVYFLPDDQPSMAADKPHVLCPTAAILRDEQGVFVWVVEEDDRARRVAIATMGDDNDGRTEVVSGVTGDERCIVDPPAGLRDGDLVQEAE